LQEPGAFDNDARLKIVSLFHDGVKRLKPWPLSQIIACGRDAVLFPQGAKCLLTW
jgi:hypothetical protein